MNGQLDILGNIEDKAAAEQIVNVASVPQRSPFRYPGGKTWLIPVFRRWMRQFDPEKTTFIEPFAGGGIVSLTVAFEKLAKQVILVELDNEIAAVWETMLNDDNDWLTQQIVDFEMNYVNLQRHFGSEKKSLREIAFTTILKNRVFHGGIITKGSGLIKNGENGKGLTSRWYPKTLAARISAIKSVRHKIKFISGDAFQSIKKYAGDGDAVFFVDPPYTVAGKRLYTYFDIDHESLFETMNQTRGHFLMTYDDTEEVRTWTQKFNFHYKTIPMKTTHHLEKYELLISNKIIKL